MSVYKPMHITGMATGLVQERQEFILPNDAYPVLQNAYVWRERIQRKQGFQLLGRLRRVFAGKSLGNSGASPWSFNIFSTLAPPIIPETNAEIEPGSVVITIEAGPDIVFTDQGDGTLISPTAGNSGTINYLTANVTLTTTAPAGTATTISFNYFPGLPVMGLRTNETNDINFERLVAFDTKYAYQFLAGGFQEFLPGTTWSGTDFNFFWSTNYWVDNPTDPTNHKIFWVTNFDGQAGEPIRYTNGVPGTNWVDFTPAITNPASPPVQRLFQCLCILPFRGTLIAFNTWEGTTLGLSANYRQRVRWSAIGTPFDTASAIVPASNVNTTAWRDEIRGQGGFLDIPTAEDIISVGFVRDNLVIYCERSTWQLRYTGRTINPFQIERVNSELGAESTFSAVQFDTSLVGMGNRGVVECDSFKSERIDIKIPDLVFRFNNENNGVKRVHGIRDFQQRLAYWTYPFYPNNPIYPNRVLAYNYENDSWAIFTNSFTTFGNYQADVGTRWEDLDDPNTDTWGQADYPWADEVERFEAIVAGNQQGFVEILSATDIQSTVSNDVSLSITAITGNAATSTPTEITVVNHNLESDSIIEISNIPVGTGYDSLNYNPATSSPVFGVSIVDADRLLLFVYDPESGEFSAPRLDASQTYIGGGKVAVRDNFSIVSKKFSFLDEGQAIQIGYIDVLMNATERGAISMNMYVDYDDDDAVNITPQNTMLDSFSPDTFFNSVVPTTGVNPAFTGSKYWQRVYCPTRGSFLTIQWTLSNAQMNSFEQSSDVQIDAQIIWQRRAGKTLPMVVN